MIDAGRSRRGAVRAGREALAKAGANVLGAILNRTPKATLTSYYGSYGDQDAIEAAAGKRSSATDNSPRGSAS